MQSQRQSMAHNKTTKTKTKSSGRASAPASASSRKKSTSGARSSTSARSGSAKRQTRTAGAEKGNRTSSARETRAREQARLNREQREREIRLDIALIVMLIIMLFLFLSMLGFGGSVGKVLADILFGLFGIVAWCVPVYLFLFSLLLLTNSMTTRMRVRLAALMILMLTGEAIAHLQLQAAHLISLEAPFSPLEAFRFCSGNHLGGGVIGGAVSWFLYYALRMVGSAVFLTGAALIGLLLLIQRSPAGALRSWHNRRANEDTPGFAERRRIYRQRRLEELERERERELEREAEKILYREEREERRLAEPEPARTRRKRKRTPLSGRNMDLEHTRLRGAGQSRNSSGYPMLYEEGIQGAVKRDVHEIVVLPAERDDPMTVPAQPRRSRAAAAGTVRPLSGGAPDPDGTRYQKPGQDLPVIHNGYDDLSQEDSPSAETMTGRRTERVPEGPELISPPQDTDYNLSGGRPVTAGQSRQGAAFTTAQGSTPSRRQGSSLTTGQISPELKTSGQRSAGQAAEGPEVLTTVNNPDSSRSSRVRPASDSPDSYGSDRIRPAASDPDSNSSGRIHPAANSLDSSSGRIRPAASDPDSRRFSGKEDSRNTAATGKTASAEASRTSGFSVPTEQELGEISVHRENNAGNKGAGTGQKAAMRKGNNYVPPPFSLLDKGERRRNDETERELKETAHRLQETLRTFGVQVTVTDISQGPTVTRYELRPDKGVKVSKIINLSDDIKLRLAATDIRIEAPIPGKSAIGIEVPNKTETTVHLRDLLESQDFRRYDGRLPFAVGKDLGGRTVISDISRMPHVLIAGATGSGKSVCINTIILSILYRTSPDQVRLLLIDPKVVELSVYKKIPHLMVPVVTDARKASAALNWAVAEMEKRYHLFAAANVRDLAGFNALVTKSIKEGTDPGFEILPRLVIIVDELADLMMVAKSEVETAIVRLAQLARAAGIHLIIATQRPSVNVITGIIKANMPSRIAFAVTSQVDSRTILDMGGAEKLLGKGDMLFFPQNYQKPARIQGAFVSDDEVLRVVDFIRKNNRSEKHDEEAERQIEDIAENGTAALASPEIRSDPGRDEHFEEAGRFIIEKNKASIGLLQRVFKIGFNRAARIMDQLADAGVVSEESSTRARMPEFEEYLENGS